MIPEPIKIPPKESETDSIPTTDQPTPRLADPLDLEPTPPGKAAADYSMAMGIAIGVAVGAVIGVIRDDLALWVAIGIAIGVFGGYLIAQVRRPRV